MSKISSEKLSSFIGPFIPYSIFSKRRYWERRMELEESICLTSGSTTKPQPRHGGCRANADWRRAPRPPAPSLSSPSSLGPRAGRPESPRGLGPAAGSREQLSGTRDSGISAPLPARRVRHSSSPAAPGTRLPPTSPPHRLLAPEEPPGSEVRPDPETPWRGRERRVA